MRYVGMLLAVALVALVVVSPASAQTEWVRGNVVSTAADSVTVKVGDADMVFKVQNDTQLLSRGAGTAMRAAERAGEKGVKFTDFVKPGVGVEVHYKMEGATMTATEIRTGVTVPKTAAAQAQEKGSSIQGKVTEVTGNSVTVQAEGKDWTFSTTPKTTIIGHGLGTKAGEVKSETGMGPSAKDLLHVNDIVTVKYAQVGEAMQASDIYVVVPALTAK